MTKGQEKTAGTLVVDGSNLATEGGTQPSLAQLREAVAAYVAENPGVTTIVVVDASFEHRIDPSELTDYKKAAAAGVLISPPAGAVGRGDGFLLQIADRTGATVLSNDSFQEFHPQYPWLFESGRLVGGKPVPGVGWIFTIRNPVRGAVSQKATRQAKKDGDGSEPEKPAKVAKAGKTAKATKKAAPVKKKAPAKKATTAIAEATADALEPKSGKGRRRRGGRSGRPPGAVNEPSKFLPFVIDHLPGSSVDGEVLEFASHGAFVLADGVRAYVPLTAMGDPPPNGPREVLHKGETRTFVVQAIDAPRRGIELAIPGFEKVAGAPSDETVEADTRSSRPAKKQPAKKKTPPKQKAPAKKKAAAKKQVPVKKNAAAKKAAPSKKAATKKKAAPVKKKAATRKR